MEVRESVLGVWSVSSVFCDVLRNFSNTDEHVRGKKIKSDHT